MWRLIAAIRHTLHNLTTRHRVADETMFTTTTYAAAADANHPRRAVRRTFSAVLSIIRAPFSNLSCFAPPPVHGGADGVWLSGHRYFSDTNHLMVSDGMRYAIFM